MENTIRTWSELVKETRRRLEISRNDFCALLGISTSTLNDWEYQNVVPQPIYQDIIVNLYKNYQVVRQKLEENKRAYIDRNLDASRKNSEFWLGVLTGDIKNGIFSMLINLLNPSNKDIKNKETNNAPQ